MQPIDESIAALGNEPPLVADGRAGPPDRREVSARWLSGTFLTGITSSVLMGVALFAALDGREMLATPPELLNVASLDAAGNADAAKANRLVAPVTLGNTSDKRRMEVSTMTRSGDRDVVRMVPFVQVKMALAAGHTTNRSYPPFDPLEVFAEDGAAQASASMATGVIYGAKVESEVSLRTVDFPIQTAAFDESSALSADEVEGVVRNTSAILTDGDVQVAALHYVDPQRFGETPVTRTLGASFGIRIVPENVSVATRDTEGGTADSYAEDMVLFPSERKLTEALEEAGYTGPDAEGMASAFATLLKSEDVGEGHLLRLGIETREDLSRIVRASLYDGRRHILTIALNDKRQYVKGSEPEPNPAVLAAFDLEPAVIRPRGDLPTVYDGIYRAAFSYGMSRPMTRQLIQLLASDVDFQAKLNPADEIEVFFSQPDTEDQATEDSQLLYVQATFGGHTRTFYRFQMEDGVVDYFDEEGRSARQFLLRNPVPNGRFTSGFGGRRHPILGYTRMHTGVDWAAPRGTPIIASGNGLVEQAGWTGGYGRQTVIRHANGYKTSYSHQSAIAEGVVEGARVRQGQVIGYVGSTGLSSGNHLHYELMVNGTKVDPMRVRLPVERALKGEELEVFLQERERIDDLLKEQETPALKMASADNNGG
ncbi:MAG: M23 family metallopeptidase [Neoaquamicrobium sediminum]|uniref:M23 family metallopeptidase n=1 Tax=Neoaquamicrobium sediminum TaxID=1849104 RepID=UPI00403511F2